MANAKRANSGDGVGSFFGVWNLELTKYRRGGVAVAVAVEGHDNLSRRFLPFTLICSKSQSGWQQTAKLQIFAARGVLKEIR